MFYLQSLLDGIIIGGVYATVAVGLSLAFGVMGIINWAHGELMMVGMYIAYACCTYLGIDPYIAMFICLIVLALLGFVLQKVMLNPLLKKDKEQEPLGVMLATAGLGMILWNIAVSIFGSFSLGVETAYTGKIWWLGDIMISVPKFISFIIALIATFVLYWFLQKTEQGRAMRATAQNRSVARLMGINVDWTFCLAFAISLGLVGLSGALLMPSYTVYPKVGVLYCDRCFIIVVLGGKGNIMGCLVGGLIIGIIERMGAAILSEFMGTLLTFVLFIIILLVRPNGIFTKKRRA